MCFGDSSGRWWSVGTVVCRSPLLHACADCLAFDCWPVSTDHGAASLRTLLHVAMKCIAAGHVVTLRDESVICSQVLKQVRECSSDSRTSHSCLPFDARIIQAWDNGLLDAALMSVDDLLGIVKVRLFSPDPFCCGMQTAKPVSADAHRHAFIARASTP